MTASERSVAVNGVSLWTATQGAGPPVVLCHGGPGIYDYLEPVADMIADLVTAHRYDQRGCGRSEDRGPYNVATFVADLDALREHWGYEAWTVVGHSWGATLALLYAIEHPERVRAARVCLRHGHRPSLARRIPREPRGEACPPRAAAPSPT